MSTAPIVGRHPIERHGERVDQHQAFLVRAARAPRPASATVCEVIEQVGRATGRWWSYDFAEDVARLILQRERDSMA